MKEVFPMKKRICLLLALMMTAVLLCGCASTPENNPTVVTQNDPLALPTVAPVTELPYNPLDEEDGDTYVPGAVYDEYGNMMYAGATPIPLDPVNMPTTTPKPALAFGYTLVPFENLGIQFEAPQGWYLDSSAPNSITLLDPNTYDGVQASLTVSITKVDKDYKLSNVKQTLNDTLKELSRNYATWSQKQAGSKTMLKKDGYYNRYTATTVNGVEVRGQVRIALLDDNRIITVILTAPGGYINSYEELLNHVRDTMKFL